MPNLYSRPEITFGYVANALRKLLESHDSLKIGLPTVHGDTIARVAQNQWQIKNFPAKNGTLQ